MERVNENGEREKRDYCARCIYERRCDSKGRLHMEQDMIDSKLREYPMFFAVIGCHDRIELGGLGDVGEKETRDSGAAEEATRSDGGDTT